MNPTEFAWSSLQSLTQKTPNDVKLLVDDSEFPTLGRDSFGFVLRLGAPKKPRDNVMSLYGSFFDADARGKAALWRLYRASVYHLSLHAVVTDYSIYADWASSCDLNNAMFAISLAEDYAIRGLMQARWPGLLYDTAFANHASFLRLRDLSEEDDVPTKVAANFLSYLMIGGRATSLARNLEKDIEDACGYLQRIGVGMQKAMKTSNQGNSGTLLFQDSLSPLDHQISELKLRAAQSVASVFEKNLLYLREVHSLPFTENHGTNYLFEDTATTVTPEMRAETLALACKELSVEVSKKQLIELDKAIELESETILSDWENSLIVNQRLIDLYKGLDENSHFENILFPSEDYAEFVRTRSRLIGPIRRVLDQLRMIKSSPDELQGMESGYVDMAAAIQVIASRSKRNDVFVRDEFDKKSEAWAILVDSSKSLEKAQGEVKEILVCLTEVAKDLIPNHNSWACYAFNENLYVVKDFSELYSNTIKGRVGGLGSGLKTLLPDALRIAAHRLSKTSEEIKVLLVASDGFPLGYDGIDEELVRAIEQTSKAGIILIGLGVGSSSIRRYFKSNCVINHPYDLMKHFARTYLELSSLF